MLALKRSFVNFQVSRALKKVNGKRESLPYSKARTAGIIFTVGDVSKHENIRKFVKILENDGKTVDVLSFLQKGQENHGFHFDFFQEDDVSFWGSFKTENVNGFIDKKFDFLFHVDLEPNPHIDHVLAKCVATCRIGPYRERENGFYEMMIKPNNNSIEELIKQIYHYTKSLI